MIKSKIIAINTILMYFKMVISIIVSLFTSRILLDALGVDDYGIYNVVGGLVVMLAFFNTSLSISSQRYITIELGKKTNSNVKKVFSAIIFVQILYTILVYGSIESIGIWVLKNYLVIPDERMVAAERVFHFAALSLVFNMMIGPYKALINAHEKMIIIAIIDTIKVLLKLVVVYLVVSTSLDKLVLYAFLFCFVAVLSLSSYILICFIKFKESHIIRVNDKSLYKELFSFSGWNILSGLTKIASNQGYAILLNLFFGTILNAAYGIARQISAQIWAFTFSIITAFNPQITKNYARGDIKKMEDLVFQASRISYFMLLFLSMPLLIKMEFILNIWLIEVPQYTNVICRLVIINGLIEITAYPLMTSIMATGRIKYYQIVVGLTTLLSLPIAYVALKFGGDYTSIFIINIISGIFIYFIRFYFVTKLVGITAQIFIKKVLFKVLSVTIASAILPMLFSMTISNSLFGNIFIIIISLISCLSCIYFFGLNSSEKKASQQIVTKFGLFKT